MFGLFGEKSKNEKDIKDDLFEAIESRNSNSIKKCINNGASQDSMYHNMTLLYYVILKMSEHIVLIEFLLQKNASITKKNDYIDNISSEELNNVLIKVYDISEITERYNKSALDLVMEKNYFLLIKLFFQYNPENKRLCNWFIDNKVKDKKLLNLLIEHNQSDYNLLKKLSKQNPSNLKLSAKVEESYFMNPDRFVNGISLLYKTVLDKDINKIKLLLESGADINFKNSENSVNYKNYDTYFEHRNKTCLDILADVMNIEIIKLFIEYKADINTLLNYFIEKKNDEIITFLIDKSQDINKSNKGYFKYTPLYMAVKMKNLEAIEIILQKGANPNIVNENKYKNFPLELACEWQNLKIIKLLVEHKADTNMTDYEGRTALFSAIKAKHANKEIVRYLIKNDADIHKEDNNGISPLSFAESSKVSLVKVLTEHEEVVLSENKNSETLIKNQDFTEKIILQNKIINKLKDEVKDIKNREYDNQIEELKLQINSFQDTILLQSDKIKELQNKLISKEENTHKLVNDMTLKISKLEKKLDKQKVIKTKIPINIPKKNHTINRDDGVIVKRESFDDF